VKAHPYLINNVEEGKGIRLEHLDPRQKMFDEKWLQDLLIRYPDLLPTGEIESIFHPLVVIGREIPVMTGRIDLLYMSTRGYPVMVETKLWRNPEAKREVVAQALEMAIAFSKWDFEYLEEQAGSYASKLTGKKVSLRSLLEENPADAELDYGAFRDSVERNLEMGRFLIAIVGDKIRSSSLEILTELNKYPALGFRMAMIELECFSVGGERDESLLIVPRIAKKTEIMERPVMGVRMTRDGKPVVKVEVPRVPGKAKPITLTEHAFWEMLKEKAPGSYQKARDLCEKLREDPFIEILPGVNGLRFRKTLEQSNQRVSLFFITTDSLVHVKLQAPRQQFASLGFDVKIVDKFGARVKEILNGFSAPIEKVDTEAFKNALDDFITDLDQQEEK
jgi:hypothetical protein